MIGFGVNFFFGGFGLVTGGVVTGVPLLPLEVGA